MPARFEIDKQKRLVRSVAWGEVTFADFLHHQKTLSAHPDFNPRFDQLVNLADVMSIDMTGDQTRSLTLSRVLSNTSRSAIVAPAPSVFGMARMYETYYSMLDNPANLRVFRDESSALEWLERDSP